MDKKTPLYDRHVALGGKMVPFGGYIMPGALASLNHLITNDYTNLAVGRVRYGVMCREDGGCLDDLIVYRLGEEKYLVVVNAANHDRDAAHMRENLLADTEFTDISEETGLLALQGPASRVILEKIAEGTLPEKYYSFTEHVMICGADCMVSRTGYTRGGTPAVRSRREGHAPPGSGHAPLRP